MRAFEVVEANLRATLGVFALAKPQGEAQELPGLALVCSAVDYSMFNTASLTTPVADEADLRQRLYTAHRWFEARGLPWSLWLCTDWLPAQMFSRAEPLATSCGLELVSTLPGMEAGSLRPPVRPLPELDIERVSDRRTRNAFTHIMCSAFGVPFHPASAIYDSESTWSGPLAGYVASRGGQVVSTAATMVHAGVIGVYAVGTPPAHQRRGYAEAVMRHAVGEAGRRCGFVHTILQSSAAGFRLYERMGYRTVSRYLVFARM